MTTFGSYARYYDLLYKDKDYRAEAFYAHKRIREVMPDAHALMELGCGTGNHAKYLVELGYELHGVDMSPSMLERARQQELASNGTGTGRPTFSQGDIRTVRTGKCYDAVISLFHVMSYQTTNEDLLAVFQTAKAHLRAGGVFIFDCWYGPAVLTERPSTRVKHLEDEKISLTRIAEPVLHPNNNTVDVDYQIFIRDKASDKVEELREKHVMRYLFRPEMDYFIETSGFQLINAAEWMTGKAPGFDTWGVCFVVKA